MTLTYESCSILLSPSLKDLTLTPCQSSNGLAIPSFSLFPAASILTRFLGLCSMPTICIHLTHMTFMILENQHVPQEVVSRVSRWTVTEGQEPQSGNIN